MQALVAGVNGALRRVPVWPFYVLGFVPAAWAFWLGVSGASGPEPVKALEHALGLTALKLLIATLAVTPLRDLTQLNLIRFRRMLGLMAFYYVCLHFTVYLALDRQFLWAEILTDIGKRPYIIVGTLALLALIPMALTSNDWVVRRLGGLRWRQIHRLAYPIAVLAALHFLWLSKVWTPQAMAYAIVIAGLLGWRVVRGRRRARRRTAAA